MGLLLEASDSFPARPRYFDTLDVYDAADGQVLYQVFKRRKGFLYYFCRYIFKLTRAVVRAQKWMGLLEPDAPEPQNPNPWEIQGTVDSAEKCEAYIEMKLKEHPDEAYQYGPMWVNRFFPDEPVKWRGLVRHTPFWRSRRGSLRQEVMVLIPERDMRELNEWRVGKREAESMRELRKCLESALSMHDRLEEIGDRVTELEKKKCDAANAGGSTP